MIAEGTDTPQGDDGSSLPHQPVGPAGPGRRLDGDPLAERRARRAAEAPEHLLTLRAEAAEATVRTLESHLATVQQRLRDAEEETRRLSDALTDAGARRREAGESSGRTGALERELQRARDREHAEHRMRMDAEDRAVTVERSDRAEIERLASRLGASERYVRALAAELAEFEVRLLEAERNAAAQLAAARDERAELERRLAALERSAIEVGHGLASERAERERAERVLAGVRRGQRRVEGLVRDLGAIVARLRAHAAPVSAPRAPAADPPVATAIATAQRGAALPAPPGSGATGGVPVPPGAPAPAPAPARPPAPIAAPAPAPGRAPAPAAARPPVAARAPVAPPALDRQAELATALAAAVERLRAGAEHVSQAQGHATSPGEEGGGEPPLSLAARPAHKHSRSLIGRVRMGRKQRRESR